MVEKIGDLNVLEQKNRKMSIILFDLDGTLIDTDYANFLSYKMAIEQVTQRRLSLTFDPRKRVNRDVVRTLLPDLSDKIYEEIIEVKELLYQDYLHETKINGTVVKILDKFSDKQMVLVTNSRRERATMLLRYHQLFDKFTNKFYRENLKSSINKFKQVLSMLEVPINFALLFENDESEIDAAISIGIPSENIFKVM